MTTNLVLMDVIAGGVFATDDIAMHGGATGGHVAVTATLAAGQSLAGFRRDGRGIATGSRAHVERRTPELLRDAEPNGGIADAGLVVDSSATSGPALSYLPSMSILQPRDRHLVG